MRQHSHELDGTRHEGCPECELIVERLPIVRKQQLSEDALARHQAVAERTAK